MTTPTASRRAFLVHSGGAFGAAWLAAHWPAITAAHDIARASATGPPPTLHCLSTAEAETFAAIAAQIVPSDELPGAREAGVVYFADHMCGGAFADVAADLRHGLAAFERDFRTDHPAVASFAVAAPELQEAYLRRIEHSSFFDLARALTVLGLLSLPEYGGNRGGLGWQLIGFEDTHAFLPPFGYYDRDYPGFEAEPAGKP